MAMARQLARDDRAQGQELTLFRHWALNEHEAGMSQQMSERLLMELVVCVGFGSSSGAETQVGDRNVRLSELGFGRRLTAAVLR